MPTYTENELAEMKDPLNQLLKKNSPQEIKGILKNLPEKMCISLARKTVCQCDAEELKSLTELSEDIPAFKAVLGRAIVLQTKLQSLLGKDKEAYKLFTEKEFNTDEFNEFRPLVQKIVQTNEQALVEHLATTTPSKKRSELLRNLGLIFPKTAFINNLQQAANLVKLLEYLNGNEPHKTFDARCEIALFHKFPALVRQYLEGKLEVIALNLSRADRQYRSNITEHLNILACGGGKTEATLFNHLKVRFQALIADSDNPISSNPYSYFSSHRQLATPSIVPVDSEVEEKKEEASFIH